MYPFKQKYKISQGFGKADPRVAHFYPDGVHRGIDYAAPCGTEIFPILEGIVIHSGWMNGYGTSIIIETKIGNDIIQALYGHLSQLHVKEGDQVKHAMRIALTGTTGTSTACHLHLGVMKNHIWVDPTPYVNMDEKQTIFNEIGMTKEELLKELDGRYAKKDIRLNQDMKDGSVWIVDHNKKYKVTEKDTPYIASLMAKEHLSDVERGYQETFDIKEVLK